MKPCQTLPTIRDKFIRYVRRQWLSKYRDACVCCNCFTEMLMLGGPGLGYTKNKFYPVNSKSTTIEPSTTVYMFLMSLNSNELF